MQCKILFLNRSIYCQTIHDFAYHVLVNDHHYCVWLFVYCTGSILTGSFGVCRQAVKGGPGISWDNARRSGKYSEQMVDGVTAVCRILPVFALIVVYWAVYSQVGLQHLQQYMWICQDRCVHVSVKFSNYDT